MIFIIGSSRKWLASRPMRAKNHTSRESGADWEHNWLVVSTSLKNISQMGLLFQIYGKKQMFQTTNQIISSVKQARKSESHWRQTSLNIYENIWIFPRIGDAPEWQCNQWIWEIWLYFHKNHLTLTFSDKVLVSFFWCFGIPIKSCAETPQPPTVLWQYGRCQYSTLTYLCLLASVHIMLTCSTHLNVYVGTFDVPKLIWTKNNL